MGRAILEQMYQDCTSKSAKRQVLHPPNLGSRRRGTLYLGIREQTDFAFFVEKPAPKGELFMAPVVYSTSRIFQQGVNCHEEVPYCHSGSRAGAFVERLRADHH